MRVKNVSLNFMGFSFHPKPFKIGQPSPLDPIKTHKTGCFLAANLLRICEFPLFLRLSFWLPAAFFNQLLQEFSNHLFLTHASFTGLQSHHKGKKLARSSTSRTLCTGSLSAPLKFASIWQLPNCVGQLNAKALVCLP